MKTKTRTITECTLHREIRHPESDRRFGDASFRASVLEIKSIDRTGFLVAISACADCGGGDMPNWDGNLYETRFIEDVTFQSLLDACHLIDEARDAFIGKVVECAAACFEQAAPRGEAVTK